MIDKTYIINLSRRNDKRKHMVNELTKLKGAGTELNHVFFDAIDGNDKEVTSQYKFHIPNWFDLNSGKAMTNGEVGCALSHYSVWKDIVASVENNNLSQNCNVLILEDDVIFLDNFMEKMQLYINEIDLKYDMIYVHRKPLNIENEIQLTQHINIIKKSYWTCGYILTYGGAKKLINSNYLDNLIPVDEFLPIMYGCNVYGFEKKYESCEKINCYALNPNLLKLTGNAFSDSETFHSQPFNNNDKFIFDGNKQFTIIYIGLTTGSNYQRFLYYCKLYTIPYIILDSNNDSSTPSNKVKPGDNHPSPTQIQLLAAELQSWSHERIKSTLILVIASNTTGTCNIIPIAPPTEIIDKFLSMIPNENNIVICKNDAYYKKTLFCAWGHRLMKLITDADKIINSTNNSSPSNNILSSMFLTIYPFFINEIIHDDLCSIFQPLNNDNPITFNHKTSRIINACTKTVPCIVFSNSDNYNVLLNRIENYTGDNWNEYYNYSVPRTVNNINSTIYISFHLENNTNILKIVDKLDYPKELLTIKINKLASSQQKDELHKSDIIDFLKSKCDYYLLINGDCILDHELVLKELLSANKDVIAPLLRRGNDAWTNFWGDIDEKGFYKRSFDYFDIIDYNKQGCWNVPYISGTLLIKRQVIEKFPNIYIDNPEIDSDMRPCHFFRQHDIFMYVSNLRKYGYLENVSEIPMLVNKNSNGEITIYDILENRDEWEKKYLHPEYLLNKNNLNQLRYTEICHDAYNFPLFSETFCKELIIRMETYGKWSKGQDEHNDPRLGKNYYENVPTQDIHFFQIGLEKQWENIVMTYVAPMIKNLYSSYKTKGVHLAFVVKYHWQQQSELQNHHDSSTYTINIALNPGDGIDFEGGGCYFTRQNYSAINQEVGTAIAHPGRLTHHHRGLKTTKGIRYILVSFIN